MKKLVLLFAFMLLTLSPVAAYAADDDDSDELFVSIYDEDGNCAATLYSNGTLVPKNNYVTKFYIPSDKKYAPWHDYKDQITSICITEKGGNDEDSLVYIGSYAFFDLPNVTRVTMPTSCTLISGYAFKDCTSLETVICGNCLYTIGDYAFEGCVNLKELYLPNTYLTIGEGNLDCQNDTVNLISYPSTMAQAYVKYSEENVRFVDVTTTSYSDVYNISKDTNVRLSGTVDNLKWDYNPYTRSLIFKSTNGEKASISYADGTDWSALQRMTRELLIAENVEAINDGAFNGFYNVETVTIGRDTLKIGVDAFSGCTSLKVVSMAREFMIGLEDSFYNLFTGDTLLICNWSDMQSSVFVEAQAKGLNVQSFELIERLDTVDESIEVANQFDGIKNISNRGNRWANTACVVTSVALMIERDAYLNGATCTVGDFDQTTTAAIVKEISLSYVMVNYAWDYIWGQHTESYDTLDGYTVNVNSIDKYTKAEALCEILDEHPEGVVVYNGRHASLVVGYRYDDNGKPLYKVWDPAYGKESEFYYNKLNGVSGFSCKHIIYIEHEN